MRMYWVIFVVFVVIGCSTTQNSTPNKLQKNSPATKVTLDDNVIKENNAIKTQPTENQENTNLPVVELNEENVTNLSTNEEVPIVSVEDVIENTATENNVAENTAKKQDIKIVYFSSWEASLLPQVVSGKNLGGIAYLTETIKKMKSSSEVITCTTGNFFRGDVKDRRPVVASLNNLGLDVCNISNLELNYGPENLKDKLEDAKFSTLCANIYEKNERLFSAYTILNKKNKKIAFVGVTSREAAVQSIPQSIENLVFRKPTTELQQVLPEIKKQADIIIVLSNLRHSEDRKIAQMFPDIDVIIGRYDVDTNNLSEKVDNTLIVRANKKRGVQLGEVNLSEMSGPIFYEVGPDAAKFNVADNESEVLIRNWQNMEKIRSEVLCESQTYLEGEYSQVRQKETSLGNLLADIILEMRPQADVAVINSGAIRSSIASGPITYGMILDVLPYKNKVVAVKVSGKVLKEVLENSVARYESIPGAFLQVGGMSFQFSEKQPVFSRVSNIKVQGEPLSLEKDYELLTLDYIASGGDDYIMLKEATPHYTSQQDLPEIITSYLRKQQNIYPRLEQRITKK